jgi:putative transposase
MARAHRHLPPGQVWHLNHRCHKREFLLKFARYRERWRQWLYKARRRYKLTILNYCVTSKHVHPLVYDDAGGNGVTQSIQLLAGRTGDISNIAWSDPIRDIRANLSL